MGGGDRSSARPLVEPLTRRERDILALLAQGHSAPEIAAKLTLAVSSVKWYLQQLYGKLGVNSKLQAVARARELGLVEAATATALGSSSASPSAPPAASGSAAQPARKHNLPVQVTRFFGRENEIAGLKQHLAEHRLVTLTGSGGVGKTRLSLQAAGKVLDDFSDGVWLVELAPLTDPALVPQHVAAVLGVRENPGRSVLESLLLFLHDRQVLLVLDNCEHLLDACAQLAEAMLHGSPGLKVLASSREPLGIAGEAVFGVRSLPFPDPDHMPPIEELRDYTAISLFVDRVRLVLSDYQVTDHNAASVARICQRLDGIPLAIELAAARVNVLSAANLAERLDDAFRVLTGGTRTALPRQQTLRATIDWSYTLLSDTERLLLQRLSVFAGGCTLDAAEAVCSDTPMEGYQKLVEIRPAAAGLKIDQSEILDLLSALVSKSMVIAERRAGKDSRYHLLETVRQYAREKLLAAGESEHLHARHLRFFVQLGEEAETKLRGPEQIVWLNRLESNLDNVRAALDYSLTSRASVDAEAGLRLAVALRTFWGIRGHWREAHAWLEAALARRGVPARSLARAEALHVAASMGFEAPAIAQARAEAAESVEIFRQAGPAGRPGLAHALITLGNLGWALGDFGPKLTMLQESVRLFRELGDKWGLALALRALAATLDPIVNYQPRGEDGSPPPLPDLEPAARNDHTTERGLYEESLALFRELGDRWIQSQNLGSLGHLFLCYGDRAAGRAMFEEQMTILREFENVEGIASTRIYLARDALANDELEQAEMLCEQSLAVLRDTHGERDMSLVNIIQAEMARRRGDYEQAIRLLSNVMAWCQKLGNRDLIAATLDGQGRVARSQGDHASAHSLHMESLVVRREAGHPINLAHSFHALALLAAARDGQAERAARLFGAAEPYHAALYAYWAAQPIWRAEHESGVAAVRAQLGEALAAQLWTEGEAMTLEQAYAYALADPAN
jgi:predicted ATPase/DNA-binding CsgD family transcriptional regulator